MPKRPIDPQGKVIASATPRSSMSRDSGAEACTLVPPSSVTIWPTVLFAGRTFRPFTSAGDATFLREWNEPGSWMKAKEELTPFIPLAAYWRYHRPVAAGPPLG